MKSDVWRRQLIIQEQPSSQAAMAVKLRQKKSAYKPVQNTAKQHNANKRGTLHGVAAREIKKRWEKRNDWLTYGNVSQ